MLEDHIPHFHFYQNNKKMIIYQGRNFQEGFYGKPHRVIRGGPHSGLCLKGGPRGLSVSDMNAFIVWHIPSQRQLAAFTIQQPITHVFAPHERYERNEALHIVDDQHEVFAFQTGNSLKFWHVPSQREVYKPQINIIHGDISYDTIYGSQNGEILTICDPSLKNRILFKQERHETLIERELDTISLFKRLLQVHLQHNAAATAQLQASLKALSRRDKTLFNSALNMLTTHAQEEVNRLSASLPLAHIEKALQKRDKDAIKALSTEELHNAKRVLIYKQRLALLKALAPSLDSHTCTILLFLSS